MQNNNNEKNAEWYNAIYEGIQAYHVHYTENRYHFLWAIVADRISRLGIDNIIDIGCGTGQFALLLHDRGIKQYYGIDFSSTAIEIAREKCPMFNFANINILNSDILNLHSYQCFVALEFFEHIQRDLDVIEKIKPGVRCYASVPNFLFDSHVRHFNSIDDVHIRYELLFNDFHVDALAKNSKGDVLYLFEGIKK